VGVTSLNVFDLKAFRVRIRRRNERTGRNRFFFWGRRGNAPVNVTSLQVTYARVRVDNAYRTWVYTIHVDWSAAVTAGDFRQVKRYTRWSVRGTRAQYRLSRSSFSLPIYVWRRDRHQRRRTWENIYKKIRRIVRRVQAPNLPIIRPYIYRYTHSRGGMCSRGLP